MLRKGFTLIELLLVVIIIGIIASIALPRFSNVREQAYRSVITSDVRTLMTQQELANVQTNAYVDKPALDNAVIGDFRPSANVNVSSIADGAAGYAAAARHAQLAGTAADNARCVRVGVIPAGDITTFDALVDVAAYSTIAAEGQILPCGG